jgi:hypothetical protein
LLHAAPPGRGIYERLGFQPTNELRLALLPKRQAPAGNRINGTFLWIWDGHSVKHWLARGLPGHSTGRAVPVVTFHGLADPQNTYAGMARADEWVESVEDALEGWAGHNRCDGVRREKAEVNLVSVYSYGNCADQADVVLYRIAGLGHTWAKNEIDATREMWAFLKERALP